MVPAGGNGNRHRPRGSRAPPRPHRGPTGCYRRRKTGRPRITSPWTCAPHRTGNPRVFELHSPLSAEEFRSLRSKRCSAYARRQTATGQTTGRMRTPKHGGRRRRRAKAGRATTRHDGGPGGVTTRPSCTGCIGGIGGGATGRRSCTCGIGGGATGRTGRTSCIGGIGCGATGCTGCTGRRGRVGGRPGGVTAGE